MKPLKKKMTASEWYRNIMKKVNYKKFIRSTMLEKWKQKNIHKL